MKNFIVFLFIFSVLNLTLADRVILKDGSKVDGKIIEETEKSVTVELFPGMNQEISMSEIQEILKSSGSNNKTKSSTVSETQPNSGSSDPIPQPTILNQPNFRSKGTWGGASDGKMIGIDGKPLEDHKVYVLDTEYFINKATEGISKLKKPEDEARLSQLWMIVGIEEAIRNLEEDLALGASIIPDTEKVIESKRKDLERANERYEKNFEIKYDRSQEYPLLTLISKLRSATRRYGMCEGTINYEEQIRAKDRINLDDQPSPQGKTLRERMKKSIKEMTQLRSQISSQYPNYLEAGKLEEEHAGANEVFYEVTRDQAYFYLYQKVDFKELKDAIRADSQDLKVSGVRPLILEKGEKALFLQKEKIEYDEGEPRSLEVYYIRVNSDKVLDPSTKGYLSKTPLEGWILADRLNKSGK